MGTLSKVATKPAPLVDVAVKTLLDGTVVGFMDFNGTTWVNSQTGTTIPVVLGWAPLKPQA